MSAAETALAWIAGIGAAATALAAILRWIRRAIRAVDVIMSIPDRMSRNEQLLDAHLAVAAPQSDLLAQMAADLGVVVHEVKHNGGSSMKDALARVEAEQAAVAAQLKITRPTPRSPR
jgi:glycerol kinase